MKAKYGKAAVWFCDPEMNEADPVPNVDAGNMIAPGCGFFGFYKPELNGEMRKCPSCGNIDTYRRLEHGARIELFG